jgi:dipeptidyl aminopeptidase/acylaminoacyl peptidase
MGTHRFLKSLVAVVVGVALSALVLAACGNEGTSATTSPSAASSMALASPSPSATPLPVPTVTDTIAFSRANADGTQSDIYLIHPDGTGLRRLTAASKPDEINAHPSWSPDGTKIVYEHAIGDQVHDTKIWVMDADGSHQTRLTKGSVAGWQPVWSPDGKHIAFGRETQTTATGSAEHEAYGIAVMDADGSHLRNLTAEQLDDGHPAWASNSRVLFVRKWHLWAVDLAGGPAVRVKQIKQGFSAEYALSPDGRWIFLTGGMNEGLIIPWPEGGHARTLIDENGNPVDIEAPICPAWTQDSKALVMTGGYGSPMYVLNLDGTGASMVPDTGVASAPAVRPE